MAQIKLAINGFGRIGRQAFKIAMDNKKVEVVAINDLSETRILAHLLKYDTAYSRYNKKVSYDSDHLIVNGKKIKVYAEREPNRLPWKKLGIDAVLECTGAFTTKEKAGLHLKAGAKKVIISAPAKSEGMQSIVCGVNDSQYKGEAIVDTSSCTTNCAGPVAGVVNKKFGIEKGFLTTIHSYTGDQNLQDGSHKDLRRARAAAVNIIPTTTGAAKTVGKAMKNLEGNLNGIAMRVPTPVVSATDFVCILKKEATADEINAAYREAAAGALKNILEVSEVELVSMDFKGNPASAIVDLQLTMAQGNLAKVVGWYDNEWAYANRLIEMAEYISRNI